MSVWGKVLGGAAGMALGGPLGALLGVLAGHAVDRYRAEPTSEATDPTQSIAFTIGVIVLSAKMAKADGVVKRSEIDTFRKLFNVDSDELNNVGKIFDLARRDVNGFDIYARQIANLFEGRHAVLEELIDSLFLIAEADDELHDAEVAFLRAVANIFGFTDHEFDRMLASRPSVGEDPERNPWAVLGLAPDATLEEAKKAHRALAREHHPDRLIAQGMPEEFVVVATRKMALINAAYENIRARHQV